MTNQLHIVLLVTFLLLIVWCVSIYHVYRSDKAHTVLIEKHEKAVEKELLQSNFWRRYHNPKNGTWIL